MKKFYLGALGCLLAMGASAQKFDQVGTMQGEFWNLQSIPVEYAYDGKSSVYTINEAESAVEYTVYNKSFAVDRTIKVDNPTSYYRTVVESRKEVIKPIEMGVVDCGDWDDYDPSYIGMCYHKWWYNYKCTNTTYTDKYVYEWLKNIQEVDSRLDGLSIVEKKEYDGGTLFVTDADSHALYFKDNKLYHVHYTEGKPGDVTGDETWLYQYFYNMQLVEFTEEYIVEFINRGWSVYFSDYYYSISSYQVDSIAAESNGTTVFFTNAYYQSYYYGKQYPILKFAWNKSENTLMAIGTKYEESYTGEWKQGLKEDSYYEENEWLWDVEMYPFCVGELRVDLAGIYATQTLFNNDEKWEFLRPIYTEVVYNTRESDRDDDGEIDYKEITYRDKVKAYEIVSEGGNVLSSFLVPEGDDYTPRIVKWDGEVYFGISVEKEISHYNYEEYTAIYSIDKNASSVKKIASTPAMRVSPALAERNSTVNVTLDAETVKNGGELIITDSNGRTVGRSHVEAGQTSVPVTTDRMGSGVYNITLTEKGQKVENARIIVK